MFVPLFIPEERSGKMANQELFLFYNVENFYPPNQESLGFHNWDDYKYNLKIRKMTNVFRFIEEDYGQLPSIIGLAEIGARLVLEDLIQEDSPICDYEIIYELSNDSRNLSVALLFDKRKLTLEKHQTLQFQLDEKQAFNTRDILHAEFLYQGKKLHLFVVHLPSKRNQDAKKEQRDYIFEKLKETLQELFDKNESVILMGDFNENPDNEAMQELLYNNNGEKILDNPFEALFENHYFSAYHGKKGVCFDQITYTGQSLMSQFNIKMIEAEIYNSPRLRNKNNKNLKYPYRTYSGSRYMGGYSDHFPVMLKLKK
ncbi:Endonuclease/Exonuclease/phosphatase family protein [Epilithonimonas hungarica]|uniref:Endonuclease/Exonuclease/phosphatase family protein n=2 Tax=Epilithonimonas hungarica TaxID=454006 RepID=A0A1G7HXD4_9FLAO|nr:Endonuclease/Exonuclease/phosphatase family protein [Epilithonimonas hungarica]